MTRRARIFLSHTKDEADFARQLSSKLSDAGLDVWSAAAQINPGKNFATEIGKMLNRSDAMVLLVSPAAVASPWFNLELEYALGNPRFEGRLITVEVKPTPKDQIPWILRRLSFVKARTPESASIKIEKLLGTAALEAHR